MDAPPREVCPAPRRPQSLGAKYQRALETNPLVTKTVTAFILSGISSLIGQLLRTKGRVTPDVVRTAIFYGLSSAPPYSHFWYPILNSISQNPVVRTIVDQIFWRPLLIAYMYVVMNLIKGKSWKQIGEIMRRDYWQKGVKAGLKIWPAAQLINQWFIPLTFRTTSMDIVSFFWDMYLTLATSSDDSEGLTLETLEAELEDLVREKNCGPILIRLSWHDAGVYSTGQLTGGCPNAAMRFVEEDGEGTFGANAGLPTVAMSLLRPIAAKYVESGLISNADLWTLAANVAIRVMGGPVVPTRFGRRDAQSFKESVESQVGRLPDGDKGVDHLREIFHPKGFTDKDIVALSGAHTVGGCHVDRSGFDGAWTEERSKFDNSYFKNMLSKTYEEETTAAGCPQFRDAASGTVMLYSDLSLLEDPIFQEHVKRYAEDQDTFFADFTAAWVKLQENGCCRLRENL